MQYATLPAGAKPSKGASKDKTRPHLRRGYIKRIDNKWELHVTDSFKAARLPLSVVGEEDESGLALTEGPLSVDALKAIERTGVFRANGAVELCNPYGNRTGTSLERVDDGTHYPNLPSLWPGALAEGDEIKVTLDPYLLLELAQSLGIPRHGARVTLTFDRTQFQTGQYLQVIAAKVDGRDGLIMPCRSD